MQIRDAVEGDLGEITAIYNEVLMTSTAIYNDRPTTVEERIVWWNARREQGYPVLVATDGSSIAGSAPLEISAHGRGTGSQWKERSTSTRQRAAAEWGQSCCKRW